MQRRKPYAAEFKHEAVTLVTAQGMGVTQVARDVASSLDPRHRWLRAPRHAATATPEAPPQAVERARLRREVAQLRMERAILQKALGICSRMPQ